MPDDVLEMPDPAVPAAPEAHGTVVAAPEAEKPRVLTYVGLIVGGLVLGLFGTVLASSRLVVHGTQVSWGLALDLVAILCCARGAAWLVGSRRGAALVGLGWMLPTIAFATTNPGGDVLLPDETRTYVYLVGASVLVVLAVALPLPKGAGALAAESRRHGGRRWEPAAAAEEPAAIDREPAAPAEES